MIKTIIYSFVALFSSNWSLAQTKIESADTVEIIKEFPIKSVSSLDLINSYRNIELKTWMERKIKVQASIKISGKYNQEIDWLKLMGVIISENAKGEPEIYSRGSWGLTKNWIKGQRDDFKYESDVLRKNISKDDSSLISQIMRQKITLTITIPQEISLNVYNAFSNVIIGSDHPHLTLNILNTNLDAGNGQYIKMIAQLSTVRFGDFKNAEVEFKNGSLSAGNIENLNIKSSASTIEYSGGKYAYIQSETDKYSIDSAAELDVIKNFGSLQVEKLNGYLKLNGKNSDIKIGRLGNELKQIVLNNSFADVRIDTKALNGFSVKFEGENSTVFAPFEKKEISAGGKFLTSTSEAITPKNFIAQVGNSNSTKIEIKCDNCNINFR
jgi:hypothetical protein